MRTNPFTDTFQFLIGQQPDQLTLGLFGWVFLALFWALLIGSVVIAVRNWQADPAQRSAAHLWTWVARTMMGAMWFQGALWKLPFPQSPGFFHWTSQIAEHAAFGWHRALASEVMLPLLPLFQAVAFFGEMFFAISLMLGLAVRLSSLLAIGFVVQLWLGLYRVSFEWPWLFWFMIFTLGWFIVHRAGRSLGLDAVLLRERRLSPPLARWHALVS
ncbi:hypothetical protein [Elioraea sp.]|uniref:hypothetical protein n=1 Tax=Elioraea sp. TaxID=2185103 RepID=UPI0025BD47D3|nr:hypothetical protein [Elioraea sp.]